MNRRQFMKATSLTALTAAFFGEIGKALARPKGIPTEKKYSEETGDYFAKILRGMDHPMPSLKMPGPDKVIKWRRWSHLSKPTLPATVLKHRAKDSPI